MKKEDKLGLVHRVLKTAFSAVTRGGPEETAEGAVMTAVRSVLPDDPAPEEASVKLGVDWGASSGSKSVRVRTDREGKLVEVELIGADGGSQFVLRGPSLRPVARDERYNYSGAMLFGPDFRKEDAEVQYNMRDAAAKIGVLLEAERECLNAANEAFDAVREGRSKEKMVWVYRDADGNVSNVKITNGGRWDVVYGTSHPVESVQTYDLLSDDKLGLTVPPGESGLPRGREAIEGAVGDPVAALHRAYEQLSLLRARLNRSEKRRMEALESLGHLYALGVAWDEEFTKLLGLEKSESKILDAAGALLPRRELSEMPMEAEVDIYRGLLKEFRQRSFADGIAQAHNDDRRHVVRISREALAGLTNSMRDIAAVLESAEHGAMGFEFDAVQRLAAGKARYEANRIIAAFDEWVDDSPLVEKEEPVDKSGPSVAAEQCAPVEAPVKEAEQSFAPKEEGSSLHWPMFEYDGFMVYDDGAEALFRILMNPGNPFEERAGRAVVRIPLKKCLRGELANGTKIVRVEPETIQGIERWLSSSRGVTVRIVGVD